ALFEIRCNYSIHGGAAQAGATHEERTMYGKFFALALLAGAFAPAARADQVGELFARYKEVSGGARWDAVRALHSKGTLKAGGLEGAFESVVDVSRGRSASHYRLG